MIRKTALPAVAIVLALAWPMPASASSEGKALYASKCASCHGSDGVPKKLGAGSKAFGDPEFKAGASVDTIVAATREGKGKMKPVKNVTQDQAAQIAEYILTIGAAK